MMRDDICTLYNVHLGLQYRKADYTHIYNIYKNYAKKRIRNRIGTCSNRQWNKTHANIRRLYSQHKNYKN